MKKAAKAYVAQGFMCTSVNVEWNAETGKKRVMYPKEWQTTTIDNCISENFKNNYNGVAIVTGDASDLFLLDIDLVKESEVGRAVDGMAIMDELVRQHGLPEGTPIATTASGGKHMFFSLSKTVAHGLNKEQNRSKVCIDGKPSTIDIR